MKDWLDETYHTMLGFCYESSLRVSLGSFPKRLYTHLSSINLSLQYLAFLSKVREESNEEVEQVGGM